MTAVKMTLTVHYPDEYPDVLPDLSLTAAEGEIGDDEVTGLLKELHSVVRQSSASVVTE